jgi:hypothetical protein
MEKLKFGYTITAAGRDESLNRNTGTKINCPVIT